MGILILSDRQKALYLNARISVFWYSDCYLNTSPVFKWQSKYWTTFENLTSKSWLFRCSLFRSPLCLRCGFKFNQVCFYHETFGKLKFENSIKYRKHLNTRLFKVQYSFSKSIWITVRFWNGIWIPVWLLNECHVRHHSITKNLQVRHTFTIWMLDWYGIQIPTVQWGSEYQRFEYQTFWSPDFKWLGIQMVGQRLCPMY